MEAEDEQIPAKVSPASVARVLVERPYAVLRDFMFLEYEWEEYEGNASGVPQKAVFLFQHFCVCWWAILQGGKTRGRVTKLAELIGPSVAESIELCLKEWEWKGCYDKLEKVLLMATTQDEDTWGTARRELYFPEQPGKKKSLEGNWKSFSSGGYLQTYWEMLKDLETEEEVELNRFLEKILSRCQCLPRGNKSTPWLPGVDGEVVLNVNPREYRLEVIQKGVCVERQSKRVMKTQKESLEAVLKATREGLDWETSRRLGRVKRKERSGRSEVEEIEPDELETGAEGSASGGSLNENEDYEETSGDVELEKQDSEGQGNAASGESYSEDEGSAVAKKQKVRGIPSGRGSGKRLGRPKK